MIEKSKETNSQKTKGVSCSRRIGVRGGTWGNIIVAAFGRYFTYFAYFVWGVFFLYVSLLLIFLHLFSEGAEMCIPGMHIRPFILLYFGLRRLLLLLLLGPNRFDSGTLSRVGGRWKLNGCSFSFS